MVAEIGDTGYLRISNGDDRANVARILFANGYTVSTVRQKKNGKAYEYFVKYEIKPVDLEDSE